MKSSDFPDLGFGVGLRHSHFEVFRKGEYGDIRWVEALTENFLPWEDEIYRRPFATLKKIRQELPVVLHGVSLSIGSVDPVNPSYLKRLKALAEQIEPAWISDHLCWTGVNKENMHDLLPLPYTEEAIQLVVEKVSRVQDFLKRRILLENVSSYVEFNDSQYSEWDFINEVVKRADCGILLDINNIYVSARNHKFDPYVYLKAMPIDRVGQIHLAGHTNKGNYLIDTHDDHVCDAVWKLYRWAVPHFGRVSTMIEWDEAIPDWDILHAEVMKAKQIAGEERPNERVPTTHTVTATF